MRLHTTDTSTGNGPPSDFGLAQYINARYKRYKADVREDMVQQVFVELIDGLDSATWERFRWGPQQLDEDELLGLHRIIDKIRKRYDRSKKVSQIDVNLLAGESGTPRTSSKRHNGRPMSGPVDPSVRWRQEFRDACMTMPKAEVKVLGMFSDGFTAEEISEELGVRRAVVFETKSRGMKRIDRSP